MDLVLAGVVCRFDFELFKTTPDIAHYREYVSGFSKERRID
jgi:hypothetical protein